MGRQTRKQKAAKDEAEETLVVYGNLSMESADWVLRDDSRRGLCLKCGRYTVPNAGGKCFVCGGNMVLKK